MKRIVIACAIVAFSSDANAQSGRKITFEVIDDQPIEIRVTTGSNQKLPCLAEGTTLLATKLEPGKPITLVSNATLCLRRSFAGGGWSDPIAVPWVTATPTLPVHLRAARGPWATTFGASFVVEGPSKVGIRVAAGVTAPCDASTNTLLFQGVLEPGQPIAIDGAKECLCLSQTHAPFVETGWTPGVILCRRTLCGDSGCTRDYGADWTHIVE